jgi:hypothetical protein
MIYERFKRGKVEGYEGGQEDGVDGKTGRRKDRRTRVT